MAVYGRSIDSVIAEVEASPPSQSNRLSFPECARTPLPWSGATWSVTRSLDCDGDTIGPQLRSNPEAMFRYELVDVPATGAYEIDASGDGGFAYLGRC